jgi:quinol-cytochrome oxidoreductase complex cytochrome b subunit
MRISQVLIVTLDGIVNVQVICDDDTHCTFVAVIFGLPEYTKATVAPDWKFDPTRSVIDTVVPAYPSSGVILVKLGFPAVVVAVTGVVVVLLPADDVTERVLVTAAVAVFTGTDETDTRVILTV